MVERLGDSDPGVLGDYRIVARLGVGGMGEVFLGRDQAGAVAAVKRLHAHLAADSELRRRFTQEVELIGRVETDFTPQFLAAGIEAGLPWFATQYVPGLTLAEIADVVETLDEPAVRRIGVWLADGLQAIHNYRVVHRDLKPSNVIVLPDRLRIVDFGIARPGEGPTLTRAGAPPGTRGYMAPERFLGDSGTFASDVFALAAVLVRMATGEAPFPADSVAALRDGMPRLQGAPAGLIGVLRRCLAPSPDDRLTVSDLRRKLAEGLPARFGDEWLPVAVREAIRDRRAYVDRLTAPDISDLSYSPPPQASPPAPVARGRAVVRGVAQVTARPHVASLPAGEPSRLVASPSAGEAGRQVAGPPAREGGGHVFGAPAWESSTPANRSAARESSWPGGWRPWRVTRTAMARTSTVVAGDTVVVAADDGVHAYAARDGAARWVRPVPWMSSFRPVVAGGVLVCAGPRRVDGLAVDTGVLVWSVDIAVSCAPLVAGGLVHLVGSGANNLVAVDPDTGVRVWSATSSQVAPVPGARGVVVAHRRTVQERDAAGEQLWRYTDPTDLPGELAAGGGAVLVRAADRLTVLDAATGEVRWEHSGLPRGGAPVVAGDTVVQRGAGGLLAFGLSGGTVKWSSTVAGVPRGDTGSVFVTGAGGLTALDAATGRTAWHVAGPVTGGFGLSEGLVHVVSGGVPRAYRRVDGVEAWAADDLFIGREPVVCHDVVYLDNGYTLYAIAAETGDRPPR